MSNKNQTINMKKLILVRHAKTEQIYDYSQSDFERKLLPRGHKDAKLIAKELKEKLIIPDLFITSKAKRARETANIFAECLGYNKDDVRKEQFIYDGYTTADMLQYLAQFDDKYKTIIIFGHNPDIASFTVNLLSDNLWHFPTSCTTVVRFSVDSWKDIEPRKGEVAAYMYPKQFK
jgi:phosphohistidine phosphatase